MLTFRLALYLVLTLRHGHRLALYMLHSLRLTWYMVGTSRLIGRDMGIVMGQHFTHNGHRTFPRLTPSLFPYTVETIRIVWCRVRQGCGRLSRGQRYNFYFVYDKDPKLYLEHGTP
jgi:hypothetical protein